MHPDDLVQRLDHRLRRGDVAPVAHVVLEELWLAVVDGSLEPGERLPTSRQLAIALNVSPRSIERAFEDLERRGVVATKTGSGTYVSLTPPSGDDQARHREFAELCRDVVQRSAALGFGLEDLLDALAEYRTVDTNRSRESAP